MALFTDLGGAIQSDAFGDMKYTKLLSTDVLAILHEQDLVKIDRRGAAKITGR